MTTAKLEAILEDLALVVSRIDEVAHEALPLEYREEVRGQAEDMLCCVRMCSHA